ncbi:MAG: gamma-glutamyltransferase [Phycisphaerales bacterium]|nr:MAG: gamma-glutamyltransferase [Phycisphaerales bacterium]
MTITLRTSSRVLALAAVALPAFLSDALARAEGEVDLSPALWDVGEIEKFLPLESALGQDKPLATGSSGVICGSSSALAMRAGLEAMHQGGTAADAALTGSLMQIVMNIGASVSCAGVLEMVYYDAVTQKVYALDAGFNTVLGEDDPQSIPTAAFMNPGQKPEPGPRGRTVLVPGFMAGLEVAHRRFGKLPFGEIFKPAIHFCEEGFPLTERLERWINYRRDFLSRLEETKAVFTAENGEFHTAGDLLTQPALAETLRAVVEHGADYMYHGPWAEHFVTAVQRDGGKITLDDLAAYEVQWGEPMHVTYRGFDVYTNPFAFALPGALNLLEAAELSKLGHYGESPETFYWLMKILRTVRFHPELGILIGGSRQEDWTSKQIAADVWQSLQDEVMKATGEGVEGGPGHTSSVVAVDRYGNVASVTHSINTSLWGESGLFVDGVSIPDAACFQQFLIEQTGPGRRMPNQTEPTIVLKEGRPVLAVSTIGTAIDYETAKVLFNLMDFGMDPKEAIDAGVILASLGDHERVTEGEFSDELVEGVRQMGMEVEVVDSRTAGRYRSSAVALAIDVESGLRIGGATSRFNGGALGY